MSQLISVRSNQHLTVDHEKKKLIPQSEIIILVERPEYVRKGGKIVRSTEIAEIRFETGAEGINILIGMLNEALKVTNHYEQMSAVLNNLVTEVKKDKP